MSKPLPVVTAYTLKGKLLAFILKILLTIVHWIYGRKWHTPPQYFHDDPRHYTLKDLLFFAYKYYLKPPLKDDAEGKVIDFFKNNPPNFSLPTDFKEISTIKMTAAGDLMPYEWIQPAFCEHLWDDIGDDFFDADIRFANLETPIDTSQPASLVPEVMLNDMHFNGDENMFDIFNPIEHTPSRLSGISPSAQQFFNDKIDKKWGFDILSTANNHSLDMGEKGLNNTIHFLKERKIHPVGTASTEKERFNMPIIEKNGIRIGFVAYTFSMNQMTNPVGKEYLVNHIEVNQPDIDLMALKKDIFYLKTVLKADFIVLNLHYGNAYQAYPGAHIVENTVRIFTECGPDIILGGHAHNIQPMAGVPFKCPLTQEEKQGFVIFSFGDFVAYDIFNWCHLSVYLKLEISKGIDFKSKKIKSILRGVEPVPVYACGVYKSAKERELRFLNAEKWEQKIESNDKIPFMTYWNKEELKGLMKFYREYFAKNLA
jgi:Bacterial capsule synthesis protein PGA_cap